MDTKKPKTGITTEPVKMSEEQMASQLNQALPSRDPSNRLVVTSKRTFLGVHRPVFFGVLAALVVVTALGAFLVVTNDAADTTDTATAPTTETAVQEPVVTTLGAAIATIEGSVEFSKDGSTWTEASGGESLAHLDYVRTLNDSRAIVLFDDGSVARLDSNTELYLSSLEVNTVEVTLMSGQVYTRVTESANRTFTVVTANDRFEALGTAYKTSTTGEKDELEVYHSKVKVTSGNIEVSEGNKYDTESKVLGEIDLSLLTGDEFAQWNKTKDSESTEFKDKLGVLSQQATETPASTASDPTTPATIALSGATDSSGVKLTWTLSGVSSTQGFKLVRSKTSTTPTYGVDEALYVGNSAARSSTWYSDTGDAHYYRVCIYFEGTCSTYSNAVQVTSPLVEKDPVVTGTVSLAISSNQINWSLGGGTAPHGYKVVLSETTGPVYPADSIQYVGAGSSSTTLPDKAAGTYYVRVCKYTNGTQEAGCVDYSNEVEYVVNGG